MTRNRYVIYFMYQQMDFQISIYRYLKRKVDIDKWDLGFGDNSKRIPINPSGADICILESIEEGRYYVTNDSESLPRTQYNHFEIIDLLNLSHFFEVGESYH